MATLYTCPRCKVHLPYDKSVLKYGKMVVNCPNCNVDITIQSNVKCVLCSRIATHLYMDINRWAGQFLCTPILRCDLHEGSDPIKNQELIIHNPEFKCSACEAKTRYDRPDLSMKDGMIQAICPKCSRICSLQENVICDSCKKPATNIVYFNHKGFFGKILDFILSRGGLEIRCDEHVEHKSKRF